MRQSQASKRARGRSGGRRPYSNNPNRSFDSNGPDVKIRGTAAHIYEKYQALARDATASGDRVAAENYMQHAEHYFRILNANNAAQNQNQQGNQPVPGQGEQPQQHAPQGERDGNGRAHGGNGQRPYRAAEDAAAGPEMPPAPRRVETPDEARTIEPASSGPTSFEPLPQPAAEDAPAPQSLRELAEASEQNAPAPAPAPESTGEDEEAAPRRSGRKKSPPKDRTDAAPAG